MCKGGTSANSAAAAAGEQVPGVDVQKQELLIKDRVYDISGFVKRHPGGSVIKFSVGTDATDAFTQFHYRSERAAKMLEKLPSRPYERGEEKDATGAPIAAFFEGNADMVKDFQQLDRELKAEGIFDPSPMHTTLRIGELVFMHLLGFWALTWRSTLGTLVGLALLGLAQGRCGWFMHEGGHGSLTSCWALDRRIQEFFYGFGCGMSAAWWRNQHNKHHAAPQKMEHDVDLATMPLVAFNTEVITNTKLGRRLSKVPLVRWWIQTQHVLFAPVTCLVVALSWSWMLHPQHQLRTKRYMEMVWMASRYVAWFLMSAHLGWSVTFSVLMYLAYVHIASSYIFTNFAVSHTHLDVLPAKEHVTWMEYSSDYTMNVENCWWVNWWMAYLNFQIEHHLFPQCPQFRFPQISHRVRALLAKHGKEYKVVPYVDALRMTFGNLKNVGSDMVAVKRD